MPDVLGGETRAGKNKKKQRVVSRHQWLIKRGRGRIGSTENRDMIRRKSKKPQVRGLLEKKKKGLKARCSFRVAKKSEASSFFEKGVHEH